MTQQKAKEATLAQIKQFMGYETSKQFTADWQLLDPDAQQFYRTEVGKQVNA